MLILAVMDHHSRVSALSALSNQSASTNPTMSNNDTERKSTPISTFDPKNCRFVHEFDGLMGTLKPEHRLVTDLKFKPLNGTLAVRSNPDVMFINWPREITGKSILTVHNQAMVTTNEDKTVDNYSVSEFCTRTGKFHFEVERNPVLSSNIPSNHQATVLDTQDLDLFQSDAWRTVRGRYFESPDDRGKMQGLAPSICPV